MPEAKSQKKKKKNPNGPLYGGLYEDKLTYYMVQYFDWAKCVQKDFDDWTKSIDHFSLCIRGK